MLWQDAVTRYNLEKIDKKTLSTDQYYFSHLAPFLSDKYIAQINMDTLWPYIHHRRNIDQVKNSTINRELEVVRHVLHLAVHEWQTLDQVPKIKMLKPPPPRVRFLSDSEYQNLLRELPRHLQAVTIFAASTGCRMGEVLNLEWHRVDLKRSVAWLDHGTTKNDDARGIPLNRDSIIALELTESPRNGFVFTYKGEPMSRVGSSWKRALERSGIKNFRFHDLRHTWASRHVMAGTSLYELQQLGGWKTPECVQRYAHLAPSHLHKTAARIEFITPEMQKPAISAGF